MIIHEVNETNFEEERKKGGLVVQEKFDSWDRLGKLKISIDEFKAKAAYLMRDPTLWSYATLKDKQNIKLSSYFFQDIIMNDRWRFVQCTAANQIGKTWGAGIIKGAHHALHTNNASVMLISRSENQAKGILDEIKWMFKRAHIDYTIFEDEVTNRFEYHIKSPDGVGTSAIRVFPPTPAILSFPATLIIMDENGFWESKVCTMSPIAFYQQCVEPRTNATKNWKHPFLTMGQIVGITNPNGQNGLAWWLRNNKEFHNYTYNWLANPNNTLEEYKKKEKSLPPIRFASVYAATYLMASGGFITLEQYLRFKAYNRQLVVQPGCQLYLGGDVAGEDPKSRNTDSSVLYAVVQVKNKNFPQNPRIGVVHRKSFPPGTPREDFYNEIDMLKKLPNVHIVKFAYDKPGVGDSVQRDLIDRGILSESQIEPLTYSLPNKSEVYLNFQQLFHQDMIEGCHIEKLQEQILALKVEQPTGSIHIKVHHKTEGVKDDEPDALANACYVAKGHVGYLESSFVSNELVVKDAPDIVSKGIKANREFEEYILKNQARVPYT
ncbi:hypothetical protein LCGC14_1536930 [marine sediment metagenome]|uniref:Terminase large subunit gp17-like C-terminal domain-containing protein n=1 Tax=marine sediment metagenome TaxID=412755 RepID=A0A0F9LA22_9ZZZZ